MYNITKERIGVTQRKFNSTFRAKCNYDELIEYLKTDKIPESNNYSLIKSVGVSEIKTKNGDNSFSKHIVSDLPNINPAYRYFINFDKLLVVHDISYGDDMLVCTSKNPSQLDDKFNYNETIIIIKENDGKISFEREAIVSNIASKIPVIGNEFKIFTSYFNNQSHSFYIDIIKELGGEII